jgi:2-methylcitrate dehydratase PrpD
VVEGQFSMPFAAAVALYRGSFGWDDYALLGDAAVEAIASRVDVRRDERLEGLRHPFGANIAVRTAAGLVERHIPDPSGEPASFPGMAQIEDKFMMLAEPVLKDAASSLYSRLAALESVENVAAMIRPRDRSA